MVSLKAARQAALLAVHSSPRRPGLLPAFCNFAVHNIEVQRSRRWLLSLDELKAVSFYCIFFMPHDSKCTVVEIAESQN